MQMAPEELTAIASIGTFIVIAVTAISAVIQLRHIRSGNQIGAMVEYQKLWDRAVVQRANQFVFSELPGKLREPHYRRELLEIEVDRTLHPELVAADWCEQAGSYAKFGLISAEQFLDLAGGYIARMWPALKEVVAIRRVAGGPAMYENFEYLAALQQVWDRRHPRGNFPRNLPRLLREDESQTLAGLPPPTHLPDRPH
jgi:hypothetical protein